MNFSFHLAFSLLQLRINAAGIPEYQYKLALNDRDMQYIRNTKEGKNFDNGPKPFTFRETSVIFILNGIFLGVATFVFYLEVIVGKIFKN